jgi:hypothetical protein
MDHAGMAEDSRTLEKVNGRRLMSDEDIALLLERQGRLRSPENDMGGLLVRLARQIREFVD